MKITGRIGNDLNLYPNPHEHFNGSIPLFCARANGEDRFINQSITAKSGSVSISWDCPARSLIIEQAATGDRRIGGRSSIQEMKRIMVSMQIRIKHGEKMIVNGAEIEFLSDANFRFMNVVRFVYGKQLMSPNEVTSPARRIYFAIQTAYMSEPHDRPSAMTDAQERIDVFRSTTTSLVARQLLDRIWSAAEEGKFDHAMRAAMRLVHHEDDMVQTVGTPPGPNRLRKIAQDC